ncbi:MAG: AAA family ATPase [Deltaproteobacteria bacterium]|jgi:CO dehydrogenase maturation factor|nr:AAA family ATPase [Deltaproteobacteria bacterium]
MKIAISGKGGVGKTTLSATLAYLFKEDGSKVLAIDADPDANLAGALGFKDLKGLVPISEMKELVAERTGSEPGTYGTFFSINPKVDDLPDTMAKEINGIKFMTLGGVKKGGGGCICPESVLLKSLVMNLVLARDEVVILDMEAGLEHLGRATSTGVNALIVVAEPGQRSLETVRIVKRLCADLHIKRVAVVGNKVRNQGDRDFIENNVDGLEVLGHIPFADSIVDADRLGVAVFEHSPEAVEAGRIIYRNLVGKK